MLLFYQVVIARHVGRDNFLPLRQLFIGLFTQHVEDFVRLLRRCRVGASHHAGQGHEMIVQPDWEIEHVLAALCLGLNQYFFHRGHFLVERFAGIGNGLLARIVFEPLVDGIDLVPKIANLNDGIVGCGDLVADFKEQIELFGKVIAG